MADTPLALRERFVLDRLAEGWSEARIGHEMQIQRAEVRRIARSARRKLRQAEAAS